MDTSLNMRWSLIEDTMGQFQDPCVVQRYDAAIGTFLEMHAHGPSVRVAVAPEVVPDGLHVQLKFLGDAVDAPIRQGVLDPPQLIEGDVHDGKGIG